MGIAELIMGIVAGLVRLAPDIRLAIAGILSKEEPTPADIQKLREIVDRDYEFYDPTPSPE